MDPEMEAVGRLGISERLNVVWAKKDGELVRYDTMYQADWPEPAPGQLWVECSPEGGKDGIDFVDHHQPGDPGFGGPPEKFWESSSLGQVWGRVRPDDMPPEGLLIIAAADHCPHAAYTGDCPGIDPGSVIAFSAEQVAIGTGKPLKEILQGVYRYIHKFRRFQPEETHGATLYTREGPALTEQEWLLFREAALWHGVAVVNDEEVFIPTRHGHGEEPIDSYGNKSIFHGMTRGDGLNPEWDHTVYVQGGRLRAARRRARPHRHRARSGPSQREPAGPGRDRPGGPGPRRVPVPPPPGEPHQVARKAQEPRRSDGCLSPYP